MVVEKPSLEKMVGENNEVDSGGRGCRWTAHLVLRLFLMKPNDYQHFFLNSFITHNTLQRRFARQAKL